jgi:3-hydroxybutyryl-CoA dehydrogenase
MELKEKKIAVVGAGLMGHGIAQIFAVKGYIVALQDLQKEALARAVDSIRNNLTLMARHGIGEFGAIEPTVARIATTRNIEEAAGGAHFVIEAVTEEMNLKQKIFQSLDGICSPETILASNTSVMSITEIARKARHRERILGTHFWNPPYLLPLVEVVRTEETASWAVDFTLKLLEEVGKKPVLVKKDVPGFVANRLQHALWREAISIVENGIADAETVDTCIKTSFGLRLPVLAPMETADMVGLDLTLAIHSYILKHLESSPEPSPLLREKVASGELGMKTGMGFQAWTPEESEQLKGKLLEYLLKVIS